MTKKVLASLLSLMILFVFILMEKPSSKMNPKRKETSNYKIVNSLGQTDYIIMKNLNQLEKYSTLIVKVQFTGKRNTIDQNGVRASKSLVQIKKIYKGKANRRSFISVYEPSYFFNKTFYSLEGYNVMNDKDHYLLFLRPLDEDKTYVIVGMYQGKYNLDSSNSVKKLKTATKYKDIESIEYFVDKIELYHQMRIEVKKKYLKTILTT